MKNRLKKKPVDGSKIIHGAVGKFADIVAEIQTGITANYDKIAANKQVIDDLQSKNNESSLDANYGARVAGKLMELIA